jgi:hypothetical protein
MIKTKENHKIGACVTYGMSEMRTGRWWINLEERDLLEDIGLHGNIISKTYFVYLVLSGVKCVY